MSNQNAKGKPKYESPVIVPLGEMAKGSGVCSAGSSVTGGVAWGDIGTCAVGPCVVAGGAGITNCVAGPAASQDCTAGPNASRDCTAGVCAIRACTAGTAATAACTAGSTI
jgi:hypothetical protein